MSKSGQYFLAIDWCFYIYSSTFRDNKYICKNCYWSYAWPGSNLYYWNFKFVWRAEIGVMSSVKLAVQMINLELPVCQNYVSINHRAFLRNKSTLFDLNKKSGRMLNKNALFKDKEIYFLEGNFPFPYDVILLYYWVIYEILCAKNYSLLSNNETIANMYFVYYYHKLSGYEV